MYIHKILLKNFRGFDEREFEFKEKFSVISGENGSGKTTILEGLCVAIGGWLYGFDGILSIDKRNISKADRRVIVSTVNSALLPQIPVEVKCWAEIANQEVTWERRITSRNGRTTHGNLNTIRLIANSYNEKIYTNEDTDLILPIVAYYSAARLWNEPIIRERKVSKEKVRLSGYNKSMCFSNSIKDAMSKIDRIAHLAYRENDLISLHFMNSIIKAIEIIIYNSMPNAKVKYDIKIAEFCVTIENGTIIPYSKLSDGYRCMISLIVDICRRMITLNPQLGEEAISKTSGVVLIDEIDLHLHPKWQKSVVSDLKKIFPEVQFIATTHSPFIIQSLQEDELVLLSDNIDSPDYVGESIEDIAENVMGVENPVYSKEKEEMYKYAQEFYKALDTVTNPKELTRIEEKLKLLTAKYSNDVAYYAFLEQKLLEKKLIYGGIE
jgi:predicted ATP-binding protein involved in virulence